MNKTELVSAVVEATGLAKKEVATVVETTFYAIESTLKEEGQVKIAGFGTFEVTTRAARKGRNPQTGEEIDIPETKAPKFKAAKALKDAVKG
ncbi:HU family DNA-binding protein [Bacillus safensis]|uniref:HU family DNA-binding protein n=1 Tax=Bacillus safensis TaxID=561879 RepID=UPI0022829082|nr:HU family DNA-binding protein [Bacillus safensis]MCY7542494.1 HU family DNA-binding protein [Bacillus safensis]MCY7552369.1 HU family DNA-binding protein [Bacillus safensis]MCY7644800.1 HU family DNA-binding protein [Bacillus safensis]MCY7655885.1 HU family DNA-binding protein [Bacillus safensis]MEC3710359.1 HU family DNA-binding protein [Bacillus safensis]